MADTTEMAPVTAEQVADAAATHRITSWPLRTCSICFAPLCCLIDGDRVRYDSNCGCVSYWTPPRESSFADLAETFNRQTPTVRAQLWRSFVASGRVQGASNG